MKLNSFCRKEFVAEICVSREVTIQSVLTGSSGSVEEDLDVKMRSLFVMDIKQGGLTTTYYINLSYNKILTVIMSVTPLSPASLSLSLTAGTRRGWSSPASCTARMLSRGTLC